MDETGGSPRKCVSFSLEYSLSECCQRDELTLTHAIEELLVVWCHATYIDNHPTHEGGWTRGCYFFWKRETPRTSGESLAVYACCCALEPPNIHFHIPPHPHIQSPLYVCRVCWYLLGCCGPINTRTCARWQRDTHDWRPFDPKGYSNEKYYLLQQDGHGLFQNDSTVQYIQNVGITFDPLSKTNPFVFTPQSTRSLIQKRRVLGRGTRVPLAPRSSCHVCKSSTSVFYHDVCCSQALFYCREIKHVYVKYPWSFLYKLIINPLNFFLI